MATYGSVGHHDWGTRYGEIATQTGRSAMEVAATVILAAGIRTVGYLTPERPADYFNDLEPHHVIHRLTDLIPWIFPSSS